MKEEFKRIGDIYIDNTPKTLLPKGLIQETRKGKYLQN